MALRGYLGIIVQGDRQTAETKSVTESENLGKTRYQRLWIGAAMVKQPNATMKTLIFLP